ncbi:MAG: DUF4389 domain-containing protein [Actinobacteria bacterium]|nr:DUF4389 domain-containing protein [Actinomycetota bacterium]NIS31486.1 DUF4389 domain-containing protein [Actinomycetota bacterium]NIU19405.1 DUF4389 domain-containing protein [Actinomycetota bacterium]NIU66604.1 DUF4389 domain-containing protein [Actinomycetota bacterium]NIV87300.1 DUF4389 domain-containing protein [Actinomycetota bacterium]
MTDMPAPPAPPSPEHDMLVVDSPYQLANWRPLVNWLLYIPHGIIAYVLGAVARAVFLIYWVGFIFTGRLIPGLYGFLAMYERYNTRAAGFLIGYSEQYPPFDFTQGPADNGQYPPVRLGLPDSPAEQPPRSAALNVFLAIPHYIVIAIIGIGAAVVLIIGWFAVLFSGAWPQGMRDFLVRYGNYYYRVWAYVVMVRRGYPSFGL